MIISIDRETFAGRLRNGDMLGVCNYIQYLRDIKNDSNIKVYFDENCIKAEKSGEKENGIKFKQFLINHSDYISETPGEVRFNFSGLRLWDFRSVTQDRVVIDNSQYVKEQKISIFPLLDAWYNEHRNWSIELTNQIIAKYTSTDYENFEVYVCLPKEMSEHCDQLNLGKAWLSFDFEDNLKHICNCEIFVGGATGVSMLASCLKNPPRNFFYYSSYNMLNTLPFNFNRGNMIIYNSEYGCTV